MCVCVYRAEAVAVQTVSVMVALDPEVTIWDSDVTVLVAQGPGVKREDVLTASPGGRQNNWRFLRSDADSDLMGEEPLT